MMRICGDGVFVGPCKGIDVTLDGAGVYVILSRNDDGYRVLYVGQTRSFKNRICPNHEKYLCWIVCGETLYHALWYLEPSREKQRMQAERQLIDECRPPCNSE